MLSYNSNLPENIYNSEFKGALDNLGLDFLLKKKCRPFGVRFNW